MLTALSLVEMPALISCARVFFFKDDAEVSLGSLTLFPHSSSPLGAASAEHVKPCGEEAAHLCCLGPFVPALPQFGKTSQELRGLLGGGGIPPARNTQHPACSQGFGGGPGKERAVLGSMLQRELCRSPPLPGRVSCNLNGQRRY